MITQHPTFSRLPVLVAALTVAMAVVGCSSGDSGSADPSGELPVDGQPGVGVPVADDPVAPTLEGDDTPVQGPVSQLPEQEAPVVPVPADPDPVAEEPVVDEPVVEAPVEDTPVAEMPVMEEPVAEEPVEEEPVTEAPVEEPVVDEPAPAGSGAILGRVSEFNGNSALAQVAVALSNGGDEPLATTSTDTNGNFRFDGLAPSAEYSVDFDTAGFKTERFDAINLLDGEVEQLQPVRLISDENAGLGGLSGKVNNAIDGLPVADALLNFRPGINKRTGDIVATATTDASGDYSVENVPHGNLTLETIKQGLETTFSTVQVLGNIVRAEQNVAISPQVTQGETRIVLTWGAEPSDLDAHLTGPGRDGGEPFSVFYLRPTVDGVVLDVDDVSSFGPETITFDAARSGTFRYSVNRFSSGGPTVLSESGARVLVLNETGPIADFFVPPGEGDIWSVFDMVDGQIRPINTIIPRTGDPSDFFAPDTLADL